jgi:hypothetical protein
MTTVSAPADHTAKPQWLILAHQLPVKPAYQRVRIWRQLQAIGAVALKSSLYILPASEESHTAFERIMGDIGRCGGEGMVGQTELLAGLRDDQLRLLFNKARDRDYDALARDMRRVLQAFRRSKNLKDDSAPALVKLRQRLCAIERIDFFGASGRVTAEALLSELEHNSITRAAPRPLSGTDAALLKKRTWITRRDIHVDRIACAWLIRRFIDPEATLKFVASKQYQPLPGELRYDMHDGEFTHEGDKCSFEVLLDKANIKDAALKAIGEIIHDLDLKDNKFGRPEVSGIAHVIGGICRTQALDEARVARGKELFDDMYEQFRRTG